MPFPIHKENRRLTIRTIIILGEFIGVQCFRVAHVTNGWKPCPQLLSQALEMYISNLDIVDY